LHEHGLWQLLVLLLVWAYMWALQIDNDGLWYRGDAARHALNGFFWTDYLRDFTWDAKSYALSYYARYPAIDPASRPPLFYLLEGAAFTVIGPSPYAAKGLVLGFALMAGLYLWAWLRRWIAPQAGWAAPLFLLLPGVSRWSHAIMLQIPALALSLAALYHARSWLEAPGNATRQFALATALTVLAILTYYPAGMVVFIIAAWTAMRQRWALLLGRKNLVPIALAIAALVPCAWLIARWAPTPLSWVVPAPAALGTLANWTFYFAELKYLCDPHLLVLAGLGAALGVGSGRWRRETLMLLSWILVMYLVLSLLGAKDLRYALLVSAPFVGLAAIAVLMLCDRLAALAARLRPAPAALATAALLSLVAAQVALAANYRVLAMSGYREVASFLAQVAPDEPVFYDGFYDGNFTFYVRAGDDRFRRRVVVGHKLLYTYALSPGWRETSFANSPQEVIDLLRRRGGARWFAIEIGKETEKLAPMRYLRQAVKTDAFELVRSFPITGREVDRVDVYRFKLPVAEQDEVELPFPVLGQDVKYRVRPIPSRRSANTIVDTVGPKLSRLPSPIVQDETRSRGADL
jgi:hypothetical protein